MITKEMTHGDIKNLISGCGTCDAVDEVLNRYSYCKTEGDKLDYLRILFDVDLTKQRKENKHETYLCVKQAIIDKKYH